jgi:acyl carrier protein
MNSASIAERLAQVFQNIFDDDTLELTDRMTAADFPAWDSLAHVNLMFAIEHEFGLEFAGNELAEMENIGELKRYLAQRTGQDLHVAP